MALTDWPAGERPRERLLVHGAKALSDAELFAVFLGTGTRGSDVIDVSRRCLALFGGLGGVLRAPLERFCTVEGLGPVRFSQLQAVVEMTRRSLAEALVARPLFDSPGAVRDYLKLSIGARGHEVFLALLIASTIS